MSPVRREAANLTDVQDLYTLWKKGHEDFFDFNVLWQKAVSIFIYIKII